MSTATSAAPSTRTRPVSIMTQPESQQVPGAFDGGRITERKPIGFPHERGGLRSVGPLFYWAWARSNERGTIALHPHQGFEILSYVLQGELNHRDTLGNQSKVGVGGIQYQQAGSGLSHEEITGPERTDFFQIWFQPDLEAALKRQPVYGEHAHDEFAVNVEDGVHTKTLLGAGSPIELATEAEMVDVTVKPGGAFRLEIEPREAFAMVTVDGKGIWSPKAGDIELDPVSSLVSKGDSTLVTSREVAELELRPTDNEPLRFVAVRVPLEPPYPLYR